MNAEAVDNPISYNSEITDCDVIKYNGEYYITGNWLAGDMLRSRDLESWGERKHIFSWNNSWYSPADPAAPDKDIHAGHIRYINGKFHYYTQLGDYITHAVSDSIWGPYIEPVNSFFAGRIDAETFLDEDGQLYFYSTRFNGGNVNYAHAMSDPWTLTGSYVEQIRANLGWEKSNVYLINEGPKVMKYSGRYYMLYAANHTGDPNYAIGCVEATSPMGFSNAGKYTAPVCTRYTPPGHDEIAYIGQPWVVDGLNGFEKWMGYFGQTTSEGRTQRIDRMLFFDRHLFVDGPTDRYTPGYHPGPAKPQLLNIFSYADGSISTNDWIEQTAGTWMVLNEEAIQSDQSVWALNTVNRDAAVNYLIEANLKFTQAQDAEDKAGVMAYYEDGNNFVIVGFDRSTGYGADNWYAHVKENGVDTIYSGGYAGSVDYSVYHKIRVTKNGGKFDIRIDDMIPPNHSTISTTFTGAGHPGIYTDHAAAAFDGVIYTIGWDEYDGGITGWGNNINGVSSAGSWSVGAGGLTLANGTGYTFKGDLMPEYQFSTQVYKEGAIDGNMGIFPAVIDGANYVYALIDLTTAELVVGGVKNGTSLAEQRVAVASKTGYNLRAVKLADQIILFVDGEEKLTLNEAYGPAQPGLYAFGMSARYNGIMAYRTEPDVALPAPWTTTDIGAVGFPGSARYFDNALYLAASGTDIWDLNDEFTFVNMDMSGNWEISARIVNLDETDYWAKSALIFRNSLAANSPMVTILATPGDSGAVYINPDYAPKAHLIWRDAAGSGTVAIDLLHLNFPMWLKLKRVGSSFTGYYSADGQNWTVIGSHSSPATSSGKIGFGLASHNNTRIATSVFDNISVAALPPNTPPAFTSNPIIEINGLENSAYTSTLANDATDADSDPLTFARISGPAWLNVASNGGLSGTPGEIYIGLNSFNVQVDDSNGGSDTATLQITVDPLPNTPPQFTANPIVEANALEGGAYSGTLSDDATDADLDPLTFSKTSGPAWLGIAANGALSGMPASGDVGLNSFNVRVDDSNGGSDATTLQITVDGALPGVASNPTPAHGATNVSINQDLIWTGGVFVNAHLLNGGTANPPPYIGSYSTTSVDVGTLAYSTTYYWSIDEANEYGTNAGPVWAFTTEAAPPGVASNPTPANGATNVSVNQDLSWTEGSFADVHLLYGSTVNPPPYIGSYNSIPVDVGTLAYSTTYYWSVDEANGTGTNAGPVWVFTTEAAP